MIGCRPAADDDGATSVQALGGEFSQLPLCNDVDERGLLVPVPIPVPVGPIYGNAGAQAGGPVLRNGEFRILHQSSSDYDLIDVR